MDPVDVCADCLKEVRDTGRTKTKYLVRATPVLATCYAKYDDILKATKPIIDKYLNASVDATSYSVVYKKRSNDELDRLELIKKIAESVDKKHTVDLTMPKKTILVDVILNVCCIGICDDYFALRKYNVQVCAHADCRVCRAMWQAGTPSMRALARIERAPCRHARGSVAPVELQGATSDVGVAALSAAIKRDKYYPPKKNLHPKRRPRTLAEVG